MSIYKIKLLIAALLLLQGSFLLSSAQDDTLKSCSLIATKKILLLKTPWSESTNAASLSYYGCKDRIGSAYLYSSLGNGDFHLFQLGKNNTQAGFFTDGFVNLKKWNFYGKFNYYSELDKDVKWVDVINPYDDNPYIMGDSIGGNYSKEYFNMQGKGSYQLSKLFSFGFDVKYIAGVGAKRKDPRPYNIITKFDISPGLIFDFNKIKLGANFRYEGSKEDIEVSTVNANTYYIFHFKGLGVYSSTSQYDDRIIESDLLGGGIQLNYENSLFTNLTEVNFYKKSTDIKRGTSHPLQVVLLEKFNTDISSTFLFAPSGGNVKKLNLYYLDKRLYGHEPVVEPKLESNEYQWSTAAKYTLYWHKEIEYGLNYSYYKIIDDNHFNWGANLEGKFNSSEITYYFVPEYNKQNLNLLTINASFEKELSVSSNDLILSFNSGYRTSYDSSLEVVEEDALLSTVNTEFITHDFEYYNSGLWQLGASAKIGKNISIYQAPLQVFLDAGYKLMISDLPGKPKWNSIEVKLGMNF